MGHFNTYVIGTPSDTFSDRSDQQVHSTINQIELCGWSSWTLWLISKEEILVTGQQQTSSAAAIKLHNCWKKIQFLFVAEELSISFYIWTPPRHLKDHLFWRNSFTYMSQIHHRGMNSPPSLKQSFFWHNSFGLRNITGAQLRAQIFWLIHISYDKRRKKKPSIKLCSLLYCNPSYNCCYVLLLKALSL